MKKFRKKKLSLRRDSIRVLKDQSSLENAAGAGYTQAPWATCDAGCHSYNSCQCGPLGGSGYFYGCETIHCS